MMDGPERVGGRMETQDAELYPERHADPVAHGTRGIAFDGQA